MEAAKSNEELAEVIRAETRRLDAMQNCSIFNQTPFFELIEQMGAAETKLDLTVAVTRLIIALEEHYELESEAA